jgi:hypothetical protein
MGRRGWRTKRSPSLPCSTAVATRMGTARTTPASMVGWCTLGGVACWMGSPSYARAPPTRPMITEDEEGDEELFVPETMEEGSDADGDNGRAPPSHAIRV